MKAKNQHQSLHQENHLKVQINKILITLTPALASYTLSQSLTLHISLLMKRTMMNLLQRFNHLTNQLKKFSLNRVFIQLLSNISLFKIKRSLQETKFWVPSNSLPKWRWNMTKLLMILLHRRKRSWTSKFLESSTIIPRPSPSIKNEQLQIKN